MKDIIRRLFIFFLVLSLNITSVPLAAKASGNEDYSAVIEQYNLFIDQYYYSYLTSDESFYYKKWVNNLEEQGAVAAVLKWLTSQAMGMNLDTNAYIDCLSKLLTMLDKSYITSESAQLRFEEEMAIFEEGSEAIGGSASFLSVALVVDSIFRETPKGQKDPFDALEDTVEYLTLPIDVVELGKTIIGEKKQLEILTVALQDKMAHTLWLIGIPNNSQISLDEDGYLSKISGHYSYGEDVVITFLYDGESETDLSLQSSSSSDGYSDILEQYRIAEQNGFQNCGEYVGDSIQYLSNWGSSFEVYYSKFDLNDDGVSELLIGAKDANYSDEISMYDFYTVNDGNPIRLVSTASLGHRAHLFIFQDGTFAVDGSGGASTHSTEFYELQHYATTATLISGHGTDMGEPYYLESSGSRRPISMDEYNELPNVTDFPQLQINWQRLQ